MKIQQHIAGHMTKMAAMPIKHFKNLLSRNHLADFDETLYEASDLSPLYFVQIDPGLTMTYFMERSNFATWAFE